MELPFQKKILSLEDTISLSNEIAKLLEAGDVVILNGDLGTGKTSLVKYICSNYQITNVSSPSFSIVNEYFGNNKVYHFDFYRIKKIEELYDIGFEDYMIDNDSITFIEWGNLMPEIIPKAHYEIILEFTSDEGRIIKIFEKN